MRRRLFTLGSALLLLLHFVACAMWTRSVFWQDDLPFVVGGRGFRVQSGNQSLHLVGQPAEQATPTGFWGGRGRVRQMPEPRHFRPSFVRVGPFWVISIPYWMIVIVLVIPLTVIGVRRKRSRRRAERVSLGLCPACGYDLRASPERCPECGTPADNNHA